MGQWYANVAAGNRALQELKKISIVEAKGYCYGWHFYQCADADLVISSDDALFGHPSFRYFGWGPRMWTWVLTMGLRPFQEMVFTGRPFTAEEMLACNFLNKVVARDQLEAEVEKYALACARNRPVDSVFQQKVFFEVVKQFQGEYMGSLLSAVVRIDGWHGAARRRRLHARRRDRRGACRFGQRQRREVPARIPAEQDESREEGLTPLLPLDGYTVIDLSVGIAGAYCTKLLADGGATVIKVEPPEGDPLRRWSASGAEIKAGDDGALFSFLACSKHSVVVDPRRRRRGVDGLLGDGGRGGVVARLAIAGARRVRAA